ncbi:Rtc3p NDAI_0C01810 [Naumovozyma dairenensis CBS 421]|uniref:Ribosome maturation protein SDO1/SBDS N-terminal domain-containing protein n=1 Tax=Naumovozyma dairenensis (strain ATCC 10597 / BCRC 20456 / CBS 421 / NBRC 0211 / NRRL Y-12639) TaxID=1071378 RepID=G0W7T1_NAUDC|nr:hypothetical protein NDAI_0C01810 [Naumovozyma dairenensis CBS 421]CCD23842.1 hypothetical protein NDAI_0C01810 [Naumovozyma dairenensis CBS 421]
MQLPFESAPTKSKTKIVKTQQDQRPPTKYAYRGERTDFIIFVRSEDAVKQYLEKPDISDLSKVVEVFQIFVNREAKGTTGELGEASSAQLQNEFGDYKKEEEVIDLILKKGESLGPENKLRGNYRNDTRS